MEYWLPHTVAKTINHSTNTSAETWTLIWKSKSKIQAMDMKFLRSTEGKTRQDKMRNQILKEELELKMC
jgi:hypothetical protein